MAAQTKKLKKGKIPSKRSINLVVDEKKGRKWAIGIPAIILIIACAALIGKFAVADRLNELYAIQHENSAIQSRIDGYNRKIEEYADAQEEYYRYTFTGMNDEELNRIDRVDVIKLLDRYIRTVSDIDSYKVYGNILTITMSDISLAQANRIVASIETNELVDFCTLTTATTNNGYDDDMIKANMTVYLNGPVDLGGNK